jgi:hypothetical protein
MKKSICLAASLLALNLTPGFGQPNPNGMPPSAPGFSQRLNSIVQRANTSPQTEAPALTKFNLDFPGGTPKELVAAIEKAMGKPLNAIIPTEDADVQLPPLKMNNVDVPQLLNALVNMSYKYAPNNRFGAGGPNMGRDVVSSYGFETRDAQSGQLSDDTIWYFFVYKASTPQPPPPMEKVCQFYSLSPYLDRGFTVDDITTAIQTGWKMAAETPTPELNYHKETKLLIAFGEPNKLQTIQQVLQTLPSVNQEFWRQANNNIRELQQQVDQLKKQLNPPPRGSSDPYDLQQSLEIRQSKTNVSTNAPAEKSGK